MTFRLWMKLPLILSPPTIRGLSNQHQFLLQFTVTSEMKESLSDRWNYGKSLLGKEPGCIMAFAVFSIFLGLAGFRFWSVHHTTDLRTPDVIREIIREHNKKRPEDFKPKGVSQYGATVLSKSATNGEEIVSFNMGRPWTRFNGFTVVRLDLNLKSGKQKRLRLGLWGKLLSSVRDADAEP